MHNIIQQSVALGFPRIHKNTKVKIKNSIWSRPELWLYLDLTLVDGNYKQAQYTFRHTKNHITEVLKYHEKLKKKQLNIVFSSTFWLKKDHIYHNGKVQNKKFSLIIKYHLSIKYLAQKRPYFLSPKSSKESLSVIS